MGSEIQTGTALSSFRADVKAIISALDSIYEDPAAEIESDVIGLLTELLERGIIAAKA